MHNTINLIYRLFAGLSRGGLVGGHVEHMVGERRGINLLRAKVLHSEVVWGGGGSSVKLRLVEVSKFKCCAFSETNFCSAELGTYVGVKF